jgi:hypothetical protein
MAGGLGKNKGTSIETSIFLSSLPRTLPSLSRHFRDNLAVTN